MRLVYFITSYRSPAQLLRLVRTLRAADPQAQVVVHHDVFGSPAPARELAELGARLVTSEHPIVWGDMTLEAVRWRVFGQLLHGPEFDWVVLLSEQDYPIAPAARLHEHLAGLDADAVIEAVPIDDEPDPKRRREFRLRYHHTYRSLPDTGLARRLPAAVRSRLRRVRLFCYMAANKVQKRVRFYFFVEQLGLPTRVGLNRRGRVPGAPIWYCEAWYALSRKAVERVVGYVAGNPGFVRYAARTIIPLESATATILGNAPDIRLHREQLHHIRWSDRLSGRPDEFRATDLAELTGSGRFFARKFSLDDHEILDRLDAHVLAEHISAPGRS